MEVNSVVEQPTPVNATEGKQGKQGKEENVALIDVEVTNENMALNVIVSFVTLAQNRGAFSLPESSKIWECVQMFSKKKE